MWFWLIYLFTHLSLIFNKNPSMAALGHLSNELANFLYILSIFERFMIIRGTLANRVC